MCREIKFRAWDRKKKLMVDGQESQMTILSGYFVYGDFTETLMQFTGLKDKNGREIYEGDIISYIGYSAYGRDNKPSKFVVEWNKESSGFDLDWLFEVDNGDIGLGCIEIEIIGNKYENPELLR